MVDTLSTRKKQNLEKHLASLHEEYDAAYRQLDQVLSQVDKEKIQRQIEALEEDIKSKQNELKSLEAAGDDSLPSEPTISHYVHRGFAALADLMQDPVVHRDVVRLCTGCEAACERLEEVRDYKDLHDWLHQLQFWCYNRLEQELARFPDDDMAVENVMDHELTLIRIIGDLKTVAERRALGTSGSWWLLSLAKARDMLAAAIEHKEAEHLKDALVHLRRVLKVQPDRVNTALKAAALATDLPGLVEKFRRVHDYLADKNLDQEKIGQFREGLDALDNLSHNLAALVADHDGWQYFDVELWGIEDTMRHDVAQLVDSWPYLNGLAEALSSNNDADWATSFREAGDNLNHAIAKGDPVQIKRKFRPYRRQAAIRFDQVDTDLKKRCGELRDISNEFTAVMRVMQ
jgi:hypothetical protein